jgi:hypothetical protein
LVQKLPTIKVYKALALPILLFVSEFWTLKNDKERSTPMEMQYFRRKAMYTGGDHKKE